MDNPSELKYKQSIVACLDIIGFKSHMEGARDQNILLTVLSEFVKLNGDGSEIHKDGGILNIRPAVTCFSDSIAISIQLDNTTDQKLFDARLKAILNAISHFAFIALPEGLFFRGSISYGQLHHSSGVLIGCSWIEAAEYEKVAGYPRVILSPSFSKLFKDFQSNQTLGLTEGTYCFKEDDDGEVYFDYLGFFLTYPDDGAYQERVSQLFKQLSLAWKFIIQDIKNLQPKEKKTVYLNKR